MEAFSKSTSCTPAFRETSTHTFTTSRGVGHPLGLDGAFGSIDLITEWAYPDGLVYLTGDGHTGVCLDYRKCGPTGEPSICWIDTEDEPMGDHQIASTFLELLNRIQQQTDAPE
jgi:hypothetical protein